MKRKTIVGIFAVVLVILAVIATGCLDKGTIRTAKPKGHAENITSVTSESKQLEILATVVSGSVNTLSKNWDADAEDDGIFVYQSLKDSSDRNVIFEGVKLPVEIRIYTTKFDDKFKQVKDRLVYEGSATIESWKDGSILFKGGIKIPFEDIKTVNSDRDYGLIYTTVTLPDGRKIEAKKEYTRIKP